MRGAGVRRLLSALLGAVRHADVLSLYSLRRGRGRPWSRGRPGQARITGPC